MPPKPPLSRGKYCLLQTSVNAGSFAAKVSIKGVHEPHKSLPKHGKELVEPEAPEPPQMVQGSTRGARTCFCDPPRFVVAVFVAAACSLGTVLPAHAIDLTIVYMQMEQGKTRVKVVSIKPVQ